MKIISFTGPKGSGKDTAASILKERELSLGKISFAGPMKEILGNLYGIQPVVFEDPVLKESDFPTPIVLDRAAIELIFIEMVCMLPAREFDYTGMRPQSVEQTMLKSPRHMLQYVGTEMIRNNVHPDWHVAAALRKDVLSNLQDGTYCVTDARFVNEYQWLKNKFGNNFTGFYVERPEAEAELAKATHQSELQVKEVKKLIPSECVLKNDGTVKDLETKVLTKIYERNINNLYRGN